MIFNALTTTFILYYLKLSKTVFDPHCTLFNHTDEQLLKTLSYIVLFGWCYIIIIAISILKLEEDL